MSKVIKYMFSVRNLRLVLFFALFAVAMGADASAVTISAIKKNVQDAVNDFNTIMQDVAVVAGVGFVFASFFKFHQHKQNPTQVGLSNGIVLLLIGAALCVFPSILGTGSKAIFGTDVTVGAGVTKLIKAT